MEIEGVWLPLITPFLNDKLDLISYKKLIDFYIGKDIDGIIPLGTTGESPSVSDEEMEKIVEKTVEFVNGSVPIFIGAGGNYTAKVIKKIKVIEKYKVDGILSVSPYYNRPDQRGIYEHFLKISESTNFNIIIYNIPYRTGRNIENSTLYRLAELENIIGLKDSCGDIKQSMELLFNQPKNFSILTGEDILYYLTLSLGGDGGILAAAHLKTEDYVGVYRLMKENNYKVALEIWKNLANLIPFLFTEPNPAPIKYCLKRLNLILSSETRLPIVEITDELKKKLDNFL
jgi:4-hydroxy-tetrahydrodipicolinate synthase